MAKPKTTKKPKQLIRIPARFYIKGQVWQVLYRWNLREEGEKVDGLCDKSPRIIYLDRSLSPLDKKITFIHELGHAILHEAHLGEAGGLEGFQEEVVVASYAAFIAENLDVKFRKQA